MKNNRFALSMTGVAALATMALAQVSVAADKECATVSKTVSAAVKSTPEDVLKIVATEVAAAPSCVCEVVTAAIKTAKADKTLVVQIVTVAVELLPDKTASIVACAVEAAPEAARALADKFGSGKEVVSGKEPTGKGPVETEVEEDDDFDFNLFHTGIGGIYLSTPTGNFPGTSD